MHNTSEKSGKAWDKNFDNLKKKGIIRIIQKSTLIKFGKFERKKKFRKL